jgi:hypothetical protein
MTDLKTGTKYDDGKLPYDLIPPEALRQYAMVLKAGATKYDRRNWEKGINTDRLHGAMMRHIEAWRTGEDNDPENSELVGEDCHHMASVIFCAAAILTMHLRGMHEFDDRLIEDNDIKDFINQMVDDGMARVVPHPVK